MKNYKITWKIRSPLMTPLDSDTIFGHLCWANLFIENKRKLTEFLVEIQAGRFILSSGFPQGYLPVPVLPEANVKLKNNDDIEMYSLVKKLKKLRYIPVDIWNSLSSSYTPSSFYERYLQKDQEEPYIAPFMVTNMRNQINRISGRTAEGNLFAERISFYPEGSCFESYLKTDIWDLHEIINHFEHISNGGFGRNKSVGRGSFDIQVENFEFPKVDKHNAHLVLSNMIPAEQDQTEAYWTGATKYAKVGGTFAISEAPFKYPFHHFLPGSVFLGKKPPTGKIINEIHPKKAAICQNMLCYSIPFFWEDYHEQ